MKTTTLYAPKRVLGWFIVGWKKRKLLERYRWYRNIAGGWTHSHAMDYMTFWQIRRCNLNQLEYKLKHGSMAIPPAEFGPVKEGLITWIKNIIHQHWQNRYPIDWD